MQPTKGESCLWSHLVGLKCLLVLSRLCTCPFLVYLTDTVCSPVCSIDPASVSTSNAEMIPPGSLVRWKGNLMIYVVSCREYMSSSGADDLFCSSASSATITLFASVECCGGTYCLSRYMLTDLRFVPGFLKEAHSTSMNSLLTSRIFGVTDCRSITRDVSHTNPTDTQRLLCFLPVFLLNPGGFFRSSTQKYPWLPLQGPKYTTISSHIVFTWDHPALRFSYLLYL